MTENKAAFKVPDIGRREKAMNLVLTTAKHLLSQCAEVIQPWYGPSAGETQTKIHALLPEISAAMALPFDRYREGTEADLSFDHEKAERDRELAALAPLPSPQGDWVTVPREPSEAMIAAALTALDVWRKSLSADEAILRRSPPMENGRKWLASATPEEKTAIRYRSMLAAAPPHPELEAQLAEREARPQGAGWSAPPTEEAAHPERLSADELRLTGSALSEWAWDHLSKGYGVTLTVREVSRLIQAVGDKAEAESEREDRAHGVTIDERDAAEQALSQAYYLVTGRSPEWSNAFGHREALEEIGEALFLLRKAHTTTGGDHVK